MGLHSSHSKHSWAQLFTGTVFLLWITSYNSVEGYEFMFPEPEPLFPISYPGHHAFHGQRQVPSPFGKDLRYRTRSNDEFGTQGEVCKGVCYHPSFCAKMGGIATGFCPTGAGVCCKFEKSCREVSNEMNSTFLSPGYPGPTLGTLVCQYDIVVQPGVCGIRLDFTEFNTTEPLDRGLCQVDQFIIMNSLEGPTFPRCGELTGYSTIVPVDPRHRVPLSLLTIVQSSKEYFKWNIKMTQVRCEAVKRVKDHAQCGEKFAETTESPTTTPASVSDSENEIPESISETDQVLYTRQGVDNAFYIAYLKQAYEAITASNASTNPNNTQCKNRPDPAVAVTSLNATLGTNDTELLTSTERTNLTSTSTEKVEKLKWDLSGEDLGRIIRGDEALINEFPWQVSIQDHKGHVCGGAIISETTILTASHCFLSVTPVTLSKVKIVVGDHNINITTEVDHEVAYIQSVIFHSHFDPYYLENDIAVIKLNSSLKFRQGVQPICLPEKGNSYTAQKAVISGWGATTYPQGKLAHSLQRAFNDIIENSECKKRLKIEYLYSTMMCAVAPNCSGTCFGDSGGPLVVQKEGKNTLVGLVSFGIGGCALFPYWPDVYTRVSEFIDWISYATHI